MNKMTLIKGGSALIGRSLVKNQGLCHDGLWQSIACDSEAITDKDLFQAVLELPENWIVAPGFVDIHIHGMAGRDVMDGKEDYLAEIAQALVKTGVTSWLATTMTMSVSDIQKALRAAANYQMLQQTGLEGDYQKGSKLEGVHLEGPYISPAFKGAQAPEHILPPNFEQFERDFYQIAPNLIKHVTCAPEIEGAERFIQSLKALGIHIALGHTGADFETAMKAKAAGASHLTHFFNAMSPAHHREPGMVGAGLIADFSMEWIADNVHVRPEWYGLLLGLKGAKSVLVTDAMCAAGLCPGHYSLGGQKVITDGRSARLESGVLAGSVLTMDQAVRNMASALPEQLAEILYAASTGPASLLKLDHIGAIKSGRQADYVILDENLKIQYVAIAGQWLIQP